MNRRAPSPPPWKPCRQKGCLGFPVGDDRCLRHTSDTDREAALTRVREGAEVDIARGVSLTRDLVLAVLRAAVEGAGEQRRLRGVDFGWTTFETSAPFRGAIFDRRANFTHATFLGDAHFTDTTFAGEAFFANASFEQGASFDRVTFDDLVVFNNAIFAERATFRRSTFRGTAVLSAAFEKDVDFGGALFDGVTRISAPSGNALFSDATFRGGVGFEGTFASASFLRTRFEQSARFDGGFEGPAAFVGASFAEEAVFEGANFRKEAMFVQTRFDGFSNFAGAEFEQCPVFLLARFGTVATFDRATFVKGANFDQTTFERDVSFDGAAFSDDASFSQATFKGHGSFNVAFEKQAHFDRAIFGPWSTFDGTFTAGASFRGTIFQGPVIFRAAFRDRLVLDYATFEQLAVFDEKTFEGSASLGRASFLGPAEIELSADHADCGGSRFAGGGWLRLNDGTIDLKEASFPGPFVVSGARQSAAGFPRTRVHSLEGTDCSGLVLADVDLADCRFAGAHNLDRLRIEGDVHFGTTPSGVRWTRRQIIAEERAWRVHVGHWKAEGLDELADTVRSPEPREPARIAGTYRALRKGREDNKDEPGGADFYYGEMEMRRHAGLGPRVRGRLSADRGERFVLRLYWLVSGYGLRASRALVSLLVTILVFGLLLWWFGFEPRPSLTRALLFSTASTSSLFRVPETPGTALTEAGQALQIALRLLGPLFFGLALFSLRGRVRR